MRRLQSRVLVTFTLYLAAATTLGLTERLLAAFVPPHAGPWLELSWLTWPVLAAGLVVLHRLRTGKGTIAAQVIVIGFTLVVSGWVVHLLVGEVAPMVPLSCLPLFAVLLTSAVVAMQALARPSSA